MKYIFFIFIVLKLISSIFTGNLGEKYRKCAVILNPISTLLCICIIWIYANGSINEALPITICLVAVSYTHLDVYKRQIVAKMVGMLK